MTTGIYQRFDTPQLAERDRFEYWRDWYSRAIDVPMRVEPAHAPPRRFNAGAEALALGEIDIVEYRFGPALGSWTRESTEPPQRLRLVIVAPSPGATGSWHRNQLSLAGGAALLLGRTDGRFRAPHGLHAIQVNVPHDAIPVTDAQLEKLNDQRRLLHDPTYASLVRPALLGLAGHLHTLADRDLTQLPGLWISLLTTLTRSLAGTDTHGADSAQARMLQARRYIHEHLADPNLSPTRIANALHISRRTFYAALPADSDGIAAEIRRQRLARAHAMLRNPADTRPIAHIAAAVGIPNATHFSRSFRDHYGLTPRELRATQNQRAPAHISRPLIPAGCGSRTDVATDDCVRNRTTTSLSIAGLSLQA